MTAPGRSWTPPTSATLRPGNDTTVTGTGLTLTYGDADAYLVPLQARFALFG